MAKFQQFHHGVHLQVGPTVRNNSILWQYSKLTDSLTYWRKYWSLPLWRKKKLHRWVLLGWLHFFALRLFAVSQCQCKAAVRRDPSIRQNLLLLHVLKDCTCPLLERLSLICVAQTGSRQQRCWWCCWYYWRKGPHGTLSAPLRGKDTTFNLI